MFVHNPDGRNLDGYLNFTLSFFEVADFKGAGTGPNAGEVEKFKEDYPDITNFTYCR